MVSAPSGGGKEPETGVAGVALADHPPGAEVEDGPAGRLDIDQALSGQGVGDGDGTA